MIVLSGIYWVDPNQGSVEDAFAVSCEFDNDGETCVHSIDKIVSDNWLGLSA